MEASRLKDIKDSDLVEISRTLNIDIVTIRMIYNNSLIYNFEEGIYLKIREVKMKAKYEYEDLFGSFVKIDGYTYFKLKSIWRKRNARFIRIKIVGLTSWV